MCNYNDYYNASWEEEKMPHRYAIVTFDTDDISFINHIMRVLPKVTKLKHTYRGNKQWLFIDDEDSSSFEQDVHRAFDGFIVSNIKII